MLHARIAKSLGGILLVTLLTLCAQAKTPKDLKNQLFERYNQKNLVVIKKDILVAPLKQVAMSKDSYPVNYDYFQKGISQDGKYQKRNKLDEHTTEEVTGNAQYTSALEPGETVRVNTFYAREPLYSGQRNEFGKDAIFIDFYLDALSGKRVAHGQDPYSGDIMKVKLGTHFRFIIQSPESQDYDAIVKIIGQYLLPQDEYAKGRKEEQMTAQSRQNVNIQPGMSKEDVIKILGEPLKTVEFGEKTFLKYPDLSVELKDGKVVDVKTN
jgi:hypothetical protein